MAILTSALGVFELFRCVQWIHIQDCRIVVNLCLSSLSLVAVHFLDPTVWDGWDKAAHPAKTLVQLKIGRIQGTPDCTYVVTAVRPVAASELKPARHCTPTCGWMLMCSSPLRWCDSGLFSTLVEPQPGGDKCLDPRLSRNCTGFVFWFCWTDVL